MKERFAAEIGLIRKRAEVITMDEENQMWESRMLGEDFGKQLVETLVSICSAFRASWWKRTPTPSMGKSTSGFEI